MFGKSPKNIHELAIIVTRKVPGYPKVECAMVECPAPYMGRGVIPNTPPDAALPAQDPFGTGTVHSWLQCIIDTTLWRVLYSTVLVDVAILHAS